MLGDLPVRVSRVACVCTMVAPRSDAQFGICINVGAGKRRCAITVGRARAASEAFLWHWSERPSKLRTGREALVVGQVAFTIAHGETYL